MDRRFTGRFQAAIILLTFVASSAVGCAWFQSQREKSARELATEGMAEYEDGDYLDAIKIFTTLKEHYPYSRYAVLAELKLADAHFYREDYEEAIAAYDQFARLHPKNEAIPYVLYQIGESYFRQIYTFDRDQTPTHQSIQAFERLLSAFPESAYDAKAREKIHKCRLELADHEIYVGNFYLKSKKYRAALARFEGALKQYADVLEGAKRQKVEQSIKLCKEKLALQESAMTETPKK
ncbi:MAG: outer membrane protein assembly factor BamD [Deltaproteobacteria bacterium]|nr:outer membrane protein assembly factor BamD [Deltaproteobacteria bacterium]MBW2070095.1 outer membrane protein assembly factor BamD [Deltaproteobacteria bacterium]